MNIVDKIDVCRDVENEVAKLVRFRDANKISIEEFCENSIRILVQGGRTCWPQAIRSLTPEIRLTLHAYCSVTIGEDYKPPTASFLPGDATDEEVKVKHVELRPEYVALAQAIASASKKV